MTRKTRSTDRVYVPKTGLEPFRTILTLSVYFRFHKDTNVVVQMLQAFQVSELQYPAYTSDYKHGCHESIHIQNGLYATDL